MIRYKIIFIIYLIMAGKEQKLIYRYIKMHNEKTKCNYLSVTAYKEFKHSIDSNNF